MRVCIINSLYKPYMRGGAESVVENVIEGLRKSGHEVVLITLGREMGRQNDGLLTMYRIKPWNLFSFIDLSKHSMLTRVIWHIIDVFNFSGAAQMKKILQQENCELVLTHNLKGIGYVVPRAIKKLGIKHIHTLHDIQLVRPSGLLIYGSKKKFLILDKIYEKLCRYVFGSPAIVVSPSEWLLTFHAKRGFFASSKTAVIQNPVGWYEFEGKRVEKQKNRDTVDFLFLGQLEKFKGILFLIDVFKKLQKDNWRLRIVGTGGFLDEVKKRIEGDSRFLFYGFVKRSKLSNIFGQTDCTIIPSLCYENSPTVIYESFAAGVPVIASDIGGIPELVRDQVNGFTFEPGDEKNLSKVLTFYLDHPEKIKELEKNTTPTINAFTTDKYHEKILSL